MYLLLCQKCPVAGVCQQPNQFGSVLEVKERSTRLTYPSAMPGYGRTNLVPSILSEIS